MFAKPGCFVVFIDNGHEYIICSKFCQRLRGAFALMHAAKFVLQFEFIHFSFNQDNQEPGKGTKR